MLTLLAAMIMCHITSLSVTIFLHRCKAHKSLILHPAIEHFMRLWLWLTAGIITREWIAIHRKHHQMADTENDPHSPHYFGLWQSIMRGASIYSNAVKNTEVIDKYSPDWKDDWIEKHLYTPYRKYGAVVMLIIDLLFFGVWGFLIWGIQIAYVPFTTAGLINGVAHWTGYQNYITKDKSKNIIPIGIFVSGEELHNNHHADPGNAKFSKQWFEFDLGWLYIRIFCWLHLAKLRTNS